MTRIIVDDNLRSKLNNLAEPLELCDESGQLLARVYPINDLSGYEPWEPTFSEEELQKTEQETESYSTAEVLAYLESLRYSESDENGPR